MYNKKCKRKSLFLGGISMNMETTKVERRQDEFLVSNIEDLYIGVSTSRVEQIAKKVPDVNETEVAILLATITGARVIAEWAKNIYKEIDEVTADNAIIQLLQNYDIDTLNGIFEEMKYYEMRVVLESDNPMRALEGII